MKHLLTLLMLFALSNLAFAQYTITNVAWSNIVDNDGDGASRSRRMTVTITNSGTGLADVVVEVRAWPDGQSEALYGNSPEFALFNGTNSYTPTIGTGASIGGELSNNTYDFRILLRQGVNGTILAVRSSNDDGDLNNELFETSSQDVCTTPAQPGAITGNQSVCEGSVQTYSIAPVSGATNYVWAPPASWGSPSSSTTTMSVTVGSAGPTLNVLAENTTCGTISPARSLSVTVTPLPIRPGTISGNVTVCQGTTQVYSVPVVSGATFYTWVVPPDWSGSSTTNSITVTVGASSGTLSVTSGNTCGNSTNDRTLDVSVTAAPATPGLITGSNSVCQGSSQTYSVTAVPGATSYTWTLPGTWTGSSTTNSITTTANASGNVLVVANNSCGPSPLQSLAVSIISSLSQPGSMSGSTSVCSGTSQVYSVSAVSGATSYTWTLPSGWTGSSTTNSINATVGAVGGNISVTAGNSCFTSVAQTLIITTSSIPAQPGSISGNTSICQGSAQTYSITAVSGATSYSWTLPGGWSGSSSTSSISPTPGSSSGSISVTAGNVCGSSTAQTLAITVNPVPAQPGTILGNAGVCEDSSNTYSIGAISGASSYTWTLPAGWTGTSSTTSITATAGSGSGNISVVAVNSCGNSAAKTLGVISTPALSQPNAISGAATTCNATSQAYSIASVSGATSYTWTLPSGWTGASTTTSITATVGLSGGTISITANNSCFTSTPRTLNVTVASIPSQPGAITGNASVCQASSQTYSITSVSGATSYTWSLPSGWSGSSSTISITPTVGSGSGNISVEATNVCGSSTARTLAVTTTALPGQPASITGNVSACQGASQTYSITSVGGATSYTWSLPGSWTGTSTSTSITAVPGGSGGNLSVAAVNSCGTGTARIIVVTSAPTLTQPAAITGNASVCSGASQTYSIDAIPEATNYTWTTPSGWTGTSVSNTITTTVGSSGGVIGIAASNSCFSTPATNLTVSVSSIPPQPGTLSGSTGVCQGSERTYSVTAVASATSYTWSLPSLWAGTSQTNSVTTIPGSTSGTVSVTANNVCGSSVARTLTVSVTALPPIPGAISGDTEVCQSSSEPYSIAAVAGATAYIWTLPSAWIGNSSSNSILANVGPGGGNITVMAVNSCGNGPVQTLGVTSGTSVGVIGSIKGRAYVMSNVQETYSVDPVGVGTKYNWTAPSGWAGTSTTNMITLTIGALGGKVSVTAGDACGGATTSLNVVVDNTPPVVAQSPIATVQSGSAASIIVQASDGESDVAVAQVKYRSIAAGGTFQVLPLTKSGNNLTAEIPASAIGELGLEYKIEVINGAGNAVTLPADPNLNKVRITHNDLVIPYTSFGNEPSNYRIFGVPINLSATSLDNIFGNELGAYNDEQWRAYRYEAGRTSELNGKSAIEPGKGYWLIVAADPAVPLGTGAGTTVNAESAAPMSIPITTSWNMIGNPYNFDLSMTDIKAVNPQLLSDEIMVFTGVGQGYEARKILRKMEGGFVFSKTSFNMIVPVKKNVAIQGGRISAPSLASVDSTDWEVGFYFDLVNGQPISGIGMNGKASLGLDDFDGTVPPSIGEFVELVHTTGSNHYLSLTKDIVPPADDHTWTFDVKGPDREVYIRWTEVLSDRRKLLYDHSNGAAINMAEIDRYQLTLPARLTVFMGTEKFIRDELPEDNPVIMNIFPNPAQASFTVEVTIPGLAEEQEVQLNAVDVQGKEITLGSQRLRSGYHRIRIDRGADSLSPGIYAIRVLIGTKMAFKRIVITR